MKNFITLSAKHILPPAGMFDVVLTNPPFMLAQEVLEKSLKLAKVVALLLRLNYLESEKRASFLRDFVPDVYVLPNRPSFIGGGRTDSIAYAWFVWNISKKNKSGSLQILASTPKTERK